MLVRGAQLIARGGVALHAQPLIPDTAPDAPEPSDPC
jgi:hypothetical protein